MTRRTLIFVIPLFFAGFFIGAPGALAQEGGLLISEIFPGSPDAAKREFVELYNPTGEDISLEGYSLKKKTKSGSESNLVSAAKFAGLVRAGGFFVVAHPEYAVEFSADLAYSGASYSIAGDNTVILYNEAGGIADLVGYGQAAVFALGAAPNPAPGESIERIRPDRNSGDNSADFRINFRPSPGGHNDDGIEADADGPPISSDSRPAPSAPSQSLDHRPEPASPDSESAPPAPGAYDYSREIHISEIFPDPVGSDEAEFIELYNSADRDIDLAGWRLGDASARRYELSATIKAKGYLLVPRADSKIALNNTGDSVALYWPFADQPAKTIEYGKAQEGQSYNCLYFEAGRPVFDCRWSRFVTPGEENKIEEASRPPIADFTCPELGALGRPIRFIAAAAAGEDSGSLSFYWDFGDGFSNTLADPEHTYFKPGSYRVVLRVARAELEASAEKTIAIVGESIAISESGPVNEDRPIQEDYKLVISELMPDPIGPDNESEWIELHNQGDTRLNIRGWQLDDAEGGSRPYTIKDERWLEPGAYSLFYRSETGLALNNTGDLVRLFDPLGELRDSVEYGSAQEGLSLARNQAGGWQWTLAGTPGTANVIKLPEASAVLEADKAKKTKAPKARLDAPLDKAGDFAVGGLVRTRGTVAVLPGVFGSQYFYITDPGGIQVYNHKKEFPDLKLGDYVEVSGEITEAYGEKRLKTAQAGDIVVLEHRAEPDAAALACKEIGPDKAGRLVSLAGEVVSRKSANIFLDDDLDECLVHIKAGSGLNAADYQEGDKLAVIGIVIKTQAGIRVQPRGKNDISWRDSEAEAGRVLGTVSDETEWGLPARGQDQGFYRYWLVSALALALLAVILARRFWKKKKGL